MGFGIATLGYGFMLTYEAGGGIIAGILLAYGFYLASKVNKLFLSASISALFLIPHSILLLLFTLRIINEKNIFMISQISRTIFFLAWLSMAYNYLTAIKQIASENNNIKLKRKAMNRLLLTAIILLGALSMIIFNSLNSLYSLYIINTLFVMQYLMILINILFLHTCFISITTASQYKKDKIKYLKEEKKLSEQRKKK